MDITLQVMAYPPNHPLSVVKETRRYRRGDIVAVYLRAECPEPPSPNTNMVFIHVTGVPFTAIGRAIKLIAPHYSNDIHPLLLNRRKFYLDPAKLPPLVKNALLVDRQITVTWTQAKNYIFSWVSGLQVTDQELA